MKARQPARAFAFAGAREGHVEIGDPAVGDVGLLADEHPFVAVAHRARSAMLAASDPHSGSVMAKAAMASPLATFGSHSRFCSIVPNSEIAPEPSPCMAKAKSARPLMVGEGFAGDREAAHVGPRVAVGDAQLEEAGLAELARPARGIRRRDRRRCASRIVPRTSRSSSSASSRWRGSKNGQSRKPVGHQSPLNSGFRLAAKAS